MSTSPLSQLRTGAARRAPRVMLDRMRIDPSTLRVLADPVRSFMVYSLVAEAKTVKILANELGSPVTRLYYHMGQLEKHGLVFVERTRVVSGIREKHYRAAARELLLDRTAFASGGKPDRDRTEALLGFVFDQSRVEITRGLEDRRIDPQRAAPMAGALMAYRNVMKLSDAQATRLYQRLYDFWMEYDAIARAPDVDGRFYAFIVALYPNDMQADEARTGATPAKTTLAPRPPPRKSQ